MANYTIASPGYFAAAGTPLLRGRTFQDADTDDAPAATVINRAMASKFWPGENALGKQVALGSPKYPTATIVGIVADVKHLSLREQPAPEMYVPYTQKVYPSLLTMNVIVRSQVEPAALTGMIRRAIASVDAELPIAKAETLTEVVNDSLAQPRFSLLLMAVFGGLALLLAAIGLYGVISYSVARRTREIGIRMALGASRRNVFAMVVGRGGRMAGLGIALGLVAALVATRAMASFLYGVKPADVPLWRQFARCWQRWRCWPVICRRGGPPKWIPWWRCATSSAARLGSAGNQHVADASNRQTTTAEKAEILKCIGPSLSLPFGFAQGRLSRGSVVFSQDDKSTG